MNNTNNLTNNSTNLNLVCLQQKHPFHSAFPYSFLVSFSLLSLLIPTILHFYAQELPFELPRADMNQISLFGLYFTTVSARTYSPFLTFPRKRGFWHSFTYCQCVEPLTIAAVCIGAFVLDRILSPVDSRDPNRPDIADRQETPLELSTREYRERMEEQRAN